MKKEELAKLMGLETKQEQAALAEMDTTPERIAERQEHISQLLNGEAKPMRLSELQEWTAKNITPAPDKLGEQLKASVAQMNQAGEQALISVGVALMDKCPVCHEPTVFENRNRLANCGHVRRSHGKLVPRDEQKAPAIAQQPGFLTPEQAERLTQLINSQETRRAEYDAAQDHVEFLAGRLDAARQELYDYLLELQGKKTG